MSAGIANTTGIERKPEILAPAGDVDCFLAALAAGADAVYLGLKNFSARMEAENFGLGELARLVELARSVDVRVYVAMNGLIKQNELDQAFRLTRRLATQALPDGLIVQDPAMFYVARQADFKGGLALSTLANVSSRSDLAEAARAGAYRVVLPRELSLDEIRLMGEIVPPGLELECFVQGALCYCVSGRCYWSSYLGGRSGLRGRCAQPCRRRYARGKAAPKSAENAGERYFACQDLELGAMVTKLLTVPNLAAWKIEGRKKGPHYVYHATTAYKILRDEGESAKSRKMAEEILEMALGRPGVKARFLPQNKRFPMNPRGWTGSGLLCGSISPGRDGESVLKPRLNLFPGDYLRVGSEDERWHATRAVTAFVPKGGALNLKLEKHRTPKTGTPVFLIDRREPELKRALKLWREKLAVIPQVKITEADCRLRLPKPVGRRKAPNIFVNFGSAPAGAAIGVWLAARRPNLPPRDYSRAFFWLPPVIWPDDEIKYSESITRALKMGARRFVCGSLWQRALFPDTLPKNLELIAGPFCNLANSAALEEIKRAGFAAAIASPELNREDFAELINASPLPLGVVIRGWWPLGVSRFGLNGVNVNEPFFSPKGEVFWAKNYDGNVWIYPGWPLNLESERGELANAAFFVYLEEKPPATLPPLRRPALFNWDGKLL